MAGTAVQAGTVTGGIHVYAHGPSRPPPTETDAALSAAIPVGQALPRRLGIHAARRGTDDSDLPPYVPRDSDGLIRRRVRTSADHGGAVLVVGDSTAGKSRALLHALAETVPERRLVVPAADTDFTALADRLRSTAIDEEHERWVLWLDDLDRYLWHGAKGLTEATVQALAAARTLVAATIRSEYYDAYRAAPADGRGEAHGDGEEARLLRRIDVVELGRVWSPGEVRRTAESPDRRLREAAAHHGVHGVAEYLAAGPDLLAEWRRARRHVQRGGHPRGHAVVTAAVDLTRTGLGSPLTRELIEQAHSAYLADAAALGPETFEEAWDWARELRLGTTGLLVPADHGGKEGWRPFDYLIEAADTPIPAATWQAALDHATDAEARLRVVLSADRLGEREFAHAECETLALTGHARAMTIMGRWERRAQRFRKAEEWFRQAVSAGNATAVRDLGHALSMRGRVGEAEELLRSAAEHGDFRAMNALASLLSEQRRPEEALHWYRRSALSGDRSAVEQYGRMLTDQGRPELAERWYREAVERGHFSAMASLGTLLQAQGRSDEAEEWIRTAIDDGRHDAALQIGLFFMERQRPAEAVPWLRRAAADLGAGIGVEHLAAALVHEGRDEEAAAWIREFGSDYDATMVGLILTAGRWDDEARRWEQAAGELLEPGSDKDA
ncbi:tetratricopeptide repeat protein [Streptomonospora alba]|uniref:tetratricopeptide repeat protein n=1 Tax=Streptomonospora alba TaxID=183763 RepID=UPI0006999CD6|nr:tetratricopeptide repeat protein [Streptomonospora alba]